MEILVGDNKKVIKKKKKKKGVGGWGVGLLICFLLAVLLSTHSEQWLLSFSGCSDRRKVKMSIEYINVKLSS